MRRCEEIVLVQNQGKELDAGNPRVLQSAAAVFEAMQHTVLMVTPLAVGPEHTLRFHHRIGILAGARGIWNL